MSGLFGSLTAAARALDAQRFGLDVVGQNIANVNTPGYSRRDLDLAAVQPPDDQSAGGGVDVVRVRANRDLFIEGRLRQELEIEQREAAIAGALGVVESTIGAPGASIDAQLTAFFDSFAALAEDPTSAPARQAVISRGDSLASAFRTMAERFSDERRSADTHIRSTVEEVNSLGTRIAALNASIAGMTSNNPARLTLQDEQVGLVKQLSGLIDIATTDRTDGGIDITIGNNRALVTAGTASTLTATSVAPDNYAALSINAVTITSEITGGRIGGLLQVRDVRVPDYQTRLDTLAYTVVQQVNALHDAGRDLDGNDAGVFFTAIGAVSGAAAAMTVSAAVSGNSRLVAAATVNAAGDNQTARAIADLRDARVLNSNVATFSDYWAQLVYRVGSDRQFAAAEQRSRSEIVRQFEALRDAVSGVSLDEEAMTMLKFQRAYEANARFFQTIDETLEILLQLGA